MDGVTPAKYRQYSDEHIYDVLTVCFDTSPS